MENKKSFKEFFLDNNFGVIVAFIILCAFLAVNSKSFLTPGNILTILRQAVWVGIMSIGMTFVIATGGIDLSVGATIGFCGLVSAALMKNYGQSTFVAIIAALAFGAVIGTVNGLLVAKAGFPPFIATLGTMQILRGLIYVYTNGIPIYGLRNPAFQFLAQGYIGPIPFPIILLIALLLLFSFVMYRTKFGRQVLAVGANEEGASLVGINIDRVKMSVYVLTGVLCAISGILITSRSEAATTDAGNGYEMDAIAAAVIGGTSMSGGKANLPMMFLGAVLMTTIRNGLNLLRVSSVWHQVVLGIVILLAVAMDIVSNKLRKE